MRLYPARHINVGGINFVPTLRRFTAHKSGAAHIGDVLNGFFGSQAMRDFDNRTFSVTVQQQVAFAVDHDGATHFV